MAITLGTFTKLDDGSFSGILKTLNVTASLTIVPVTKLSDNAPDHRIFAGNGQRYEVGAGWSQIAKSSGETYLNLKIGAPDYVEFVMLDGGERPFWCRTALHKGGRVGRRQGGWRCGTGSSGPDEGIAGIGLDQVGVDGCREGWIVELDGMVGRIVLGHAQPCGPDFDIAGQDAQGGCLFVGAGFGGDKAGLDVDGEGADGAGEHAILVAGESADLGHAFTHHLWRQGHVVNRKRVRRLTGGPCQDAMARHGKPEIFNTDQGGQFTSPKFTGILTDAGIKVSMDGRGRWMDNVFIERLWRSLKYECVYLHAFETGSEARAGIGRWIDYYNNQRPHSALGGQTPDETYRQAADRMCLAA